MKRILLFDTIIDGHHADYLTHLVNYWLEHQPADELIVVTQAAFEPVFERLCAAKPAHRHTIRFAAIPAATIAAVHGASSLKRSFAEWNLLQEYSQNYQPTHALLMYFDIFQLAIWLGRKTSCAVSGIYFRPDFHYGTPVGLKAKLNAFRKKITLRGMLRRRTVANLFCLDHSAVASLRLMSPQTNVLPLPDPVDSYPVDTTAINQIRRSLHLEPGQKTFLLFGHLDERKGIEPLLDALLLLNPKLHTSVCLLLVGPIKPVYQQQIDAKITAINPNIQIIRVYSEVKGPAIQTYFDLADYALVLYQRHVGMASVVVRAAVSGKPLLASDYGYVGQLVQREQLGAVVDSTSPTAICQLLEQVLTQGITYSTTNLQRLAKENSDVAFGETIFENLG